MDEAKTSAARDDGMAGSGRPGRARARAYLDLWECNLVHVALHGPEPRPDAPPEAPPPAARDVRRPPG